LTVRHKSPLPAAGTLDNRFMVKTLPFQNTVLPMRFSRSQMLGMAGAAIWLVAISAVFTVLSLTMIGTAVARLVLASVVIATIAYLVASVEVIRVTLRLPGDPPRTPEVRVMLRRFYTTVVAEVIAIMVVNGICAGMQHVELCAPLDLLIVGIHFLPLAWIFRVPRYYWMGGLFCLATVLTLVLFPVHAQVGAADAWFVIPTFGCTLVAWGTAAFNLREVWQSVSLNS
jgi:hypothetical protein